LNNPILAHSLLSGKPTLFLKETDRAPTRKLPKKTLLLGVATMTFEQSIKGKNSQAPEATQSAWANIANDAYPLPATKAAWFLNSGSVPGMSPEEVQEIKKELEGRIPSNWGAGVGFNPYGRQIKG
jgi:hypothetical protein